MLKRIIYFSYYLKKTDYKVFKRFLKYTKQVTHKSYFRIIQDTILCTFKYNISLLEYFQFRFLEKDKAERRKWAGTGFMYEYQLIMNPKSKRDILDDKRKFFRRYNKFVKHKTASLEDLKNNIKLAEELFHGLDEKVVFKLAEGKCGAQVDIRSVKDFNSPLEIIRFMESNKYNLVEGFIVQHPDLNRLSPSSVNTIRIITQLNKNDKVEILGCRQRISVNSIVDNLAAGNIVATIDEETGIINSPAVYSDITLEEVSVHPISGTTIVGFKIPFWQETIRMVKEAALLWPQNRSIGWDIIITKEGPGLLEGNHDWCKLVWQLPAKKGMKSELDKHLNEYQNL